MTQDPKKHFNYEDEEIQKNLKQQSIVITQKMLKSLIQGNIDKISFKELAERHTLPTLEKDVSEQNAQFQEIFNVLTLHCLELIKTTIPPLEQSLARINIETNNSLSAGRFLGSFVFDSVAPLVEKFTEQQKK